MMVTRKTWEDIFGKLTDEEYMKIFNEEFFRR